MNSERVTTQVVLFSQKTALKSFIEENKKNSLQSFKVFVEKIWLGISELVRTKPTETSKGLHISKKIKTNSLEIA